MSVRAGIVVTGTELLDGRIRDDNGPWLSERLFDLGVDLAHITICGDRPADMEAQLRFMADEGVHVVITSGGLGPTADDLTVEVVARFCERPLVLDERLETRIGEILAPLMKRWKGVDPAAVLTANRKQAMVPEGAEVLDPVGTAPGVVIAHEPNRRPAVVVLPGPPWELQSMWPAAIATFGFRAAVGAAAKPQRRTLRLFGIPESEIAETLRVAEGEVDGLEALEITTCLRRGEVEVVARFASDAEPAWTRLLGLIEERHREALFSSDGSRVDDQVADLLHGRRIALAESCSGGLLAARLTERPGSSAYVAGGVVAYADEAKTRLLGVEPSLIERHGAVSPEVAEAMALGAIDRFDADSAIAITGIAGPGGATEEKPVGYVCWNARLADGRSLARDVQVPGGRDAVRDRSTTVAMHLLRRLLRGEDAHI